ncbi:unnamed protein product [Peronospora effusa]|uniref:mRNA export factor GLE1 n=1 Tax=Peronospora effusa TaxID=542832 RepID=A0A3M6VL76_9STRA|nr:hypothetical protein DD238_003174 [Peronospora effusa]RQM10256.1 hypothetical protein DD237_002302 [Peronospora effusa]CAI5711820.1 unnamed protein product [Peronospora effusa]
MRFGVALKEEVALSALTATTSAYWDIQGIQQCCVDVAEGRRRFRAPSLDSSTTSSDDEKSLLHSDVNNRNAAVLALETLQLTDNSRHELVKQVERLCERKAAQSVASSEAYQVLCETLQRAREKAEGQLRRLDVDKEGVGEEMDVLRKQQQLEREATVKLQQIHRMERLAIDNVEKKLCVYQQTREEEERREEEQREQEEAQVRRDQEAYEKKLQEDKKKEEVQEAQRKAEQELEEAQAKAKAQAAERAAAWKKQETEREKVEAAKRAAEREAGTQVKKHVKEGRECIKRLEALHRETAEILASLDPSVKKIRMQIRREAGAHAGACNQIAAAPSAIKNVVSKIQRLLQMAKTSGETYFKFALDMVASNLSKQVEGRADYKSCYPIAHVIKMSCVQTPELTDVILGYFHTTCVFTIPDSPEKQASQTIAEYKISVGFHKAVGESSDPDGLEHVTEYTRRITMISAVLAAVRQTAPWDGSPSPPGLDLGDCWSWLAWLLNEPPHLMTGALTLTILEVAGFELWRNYKKQFHKLLVLIARDVCPRLSKNAKTGAANAAGQLEMFVNQYHANRCMLTEPDGRKLEETKISEADEERSDRNDSGGGGYRGGRGGGRGGGRRGGRRR